MLPLFLALALAPPPTAAVTPPTPTAAAATATPEGKRRVLVLDFKADGVDDATTRTLNAIVANAFARGDGLLVTSGADLRAALDVEASKQTLSCADDSCFADLAGALGAQLVVSGSVGKLGNLLVVTISLYDAVLQASVARRKVEDRELAALSPKLDAAVDEMLGVQVAKPAAPNTLAFVVLGSGAALVVGGAVAATAGFLIQEDPKSAGAQKEGAALAYPVGLATAGAGVAAVVVGGILLGLGTSE